MESTIFEGFTFIFFMGKRIKINTCSFLEVQKDHLIHLKKLLNYIKIQNGVLGCSPKIGLKICRGKRFAGFCLPGWSETEMTEMLSISILSIRYPRTIFSISSKLTKWRQIFKKNSFFAFFFE